MKRHLPARLLVCAALVGTTSLVAVAGFAGVGGAATPLKLTCTKLSGTEASQTETGCTGTAAIAADAGKVPVTGVQTAIGATRRHRGLSSSKSPGRRAASMPFCRSRKRPRRRRFRLQTVPPPTPEVRNWPPM